LTESCQCLCAFSCATSIDELPNDQKEVLMMRMYQDMSFKEISEITGVSINTSLGRMRYALMNLRKVIDKRKLFFNLIIFYSLLRS
jgi:DNA-directed RNA polymerase specialized sigma24 family protein